MGQAEQGSAPPPLPLFTLLRWFVPALYLVCTSLICASLWEDYQRAKLAEEVAQLVTEHKPAKIGDVEALLSHRLGERLDDYPSPDNPKHSYRGFQLVPRVWLMLWVEYESDTGNVVDVSMLYGSSDGVSLESPRDDLREVPAYAWFLAILPALVCCVAWLRVNKSMESTGWVQWAIAALAALPLPLYVFAAIIALMRITI